MFCWFFLFFPLLLAFGSGFSCVCKHLTVSNNYLDWCSRIVYLGRTTPSGEKPVTPRDWAEQIQASSLDCFDDMARREARDDETDSHFETLANHELEKAGWKYRVDFNTPKELRPRRWDEELNSHTFAAKVVTKLGLAWPHSIPVLPHYSHWILDTILSAPSNRSIKTE